VVSEWMSQLGALGMLPRTGINMIHDGNEKGPLHNRYENPFHIDKAWRFSFCSCVACSSYAGFALPIFLCQSDSWA